MVLFKVQDGREADKVVLIACCRMPIHELLDASCSLPVANCDLLTCQLLVARIHELLFSISLPMLNQISLNHEMLDSMILIHDLLKTSYNLYRPMASGSEQLASSNS